MIRVIGQDHVLTAIRNQYLRGQVHHSWFFQGEPGVGKLETALWFAQGFYCSDQTRLNPQSAEISCGKCQSCQEIELYRHPHLLLLTLGDRLPGIRYFHQALISNSISSREKILHQLRREMWHLLARHRQQLLDSVNRDKTTYQEGVKLSQEETEKLLHQVRLKYREVLLPFHEIGEIPACLMGQRGEEFLEDMRKLQNCLDRSILTKENLDRILTWCKFNTGGRKLVVIENIEFINNNVVGTFLKILEDPPPNVFFILISEDIDNSNSEVTVPLLSRCLTFTFNPLIGRIDEILNNKFGVSTEVVSSERNFQIFFQKTMKSDGFSSLEFFLQPIHQILSPNQNIQEKEIVSGLYQLLGEYADNGKTRQKTIKISFRQAQAIINFLNKNYPLVKKNNYNNSHFLVDTSIYIKKILKK